MEGNTCAAPDGNSVWTLGMSSKNFALVVISILGFLPLGTILLGPKLVFSIGGWLGGYLRKKTEGRRGQILELVEKDELAWVEGNKKGERRDSDEWENVEGLAGGKGGKGVKIGSEFDGVVAFFHPFWYVQLVIRRLVEC